MGELVTAARAEIALVEILRLESNNLTLRRALMDSVMLINQIVNSKMVCRRKNTTLSMAIKNQQLSNIQVSKIIKTSQVF